MIIGCSIRIFSIGLITPITDSYTIAITCSCRGQVVTGCNIPLFNDSHTYANQGPRPICYKPLQAAVKLLALQPPRSFDVARALHRLIRMTTLRLLDATNIESTAVLVLLALRLLGKMVSACLRISLVDMRKILPADAFKVELCCSGKLHM